jgi:hypothetical protein
VIPATLTDLINDAGYVTSSSETDPNFTGWNRSSGITIDASQISDFATSVINNAAVLANTAKNSYPAADAAKLAGIASGAEVNINADWNAIEGDALIANKPVLSAIATSGSYDDLINKPSLFNGSYTSLTGKPAMWDSTWVSIKNKPVFFDGNYNSLSNLPVIPTNLTDLINDAGYVTSSSETDPNFTGWNRSSGISINASQISDFEISVSNNATVLANTAKNSYPAADATKLAGIASGAEVNINADWNAIEGDALIANKPVLANIATSGSFEDLIGKPTTVAGYGITDAVSSENIQSSELIYALSTGNSNNYIIDLNPAKSSYNLGMVVNFKANFDNTGAATININGLGPKSIKKMVTNELDSKDIKNEQMISIIFDGTNFQLLSPIQISSGGSGSTSNTLLYTITGF